MASTSTILCGPCGYDHYNKPAKSWCTYCEEGFCGDCEKVHRATKMSRDHKFIEIDDYKQISDVTINQTCLEHDKRFEFYCKTHDNVLCKACLLSLHRACTDVIPLDDVAKNAKTSTALADLEDSICDVLKNVKSLIQDREIASKTIVTQEKMIKNKIEESRVKINKCLDTMEEKLIHELAIKSNGHKAKNESILTYLESTENTLMGLNKKINAIKQFASDQQVFLGVHQLSKTLNKTLNLARTDVGSMENVQIKVQFHSIINSLLTDVNKYGYISIDTTPTNIPVFPQKLDQAQMHMRMLSMKNSNDIHLQLQYKVKIKQESSGVMWISGCTILPDGQILIADYRGKRQLMQYGTQGTSYLDIPVSANPFDLTLIETERVGISYGHAGYIEILNISSRKVEKRIELNDCCCGISCHDEKLYVVVDNHGIVVVNLEGNFINTIRIGIDDVERITTKRDRIYYTHFKKDIVKCCTLTGDEIWSFHDDSVNLALGIAVDSNGNVFVLGKDSNNLTVISHDGKTSKTLLTVSDGLAIPRAICYSEVQKLLLVCNEDNRQAFCFKVT